MMDPIFAVLYFSINVKVAVDWAGRVLGPDAAWLVPLSVSVSAFGTLHASLFSSGRQVGPVLVQVCRCDSSGVGSQQGGSPPSHHLLCQPGAPHPAAGPPLPLLPHPGLHVSPGYQPAPQHVHGRHGLLLRTVHACPASSQTNQTLGTQTLQG